MRRPHTSVPCGKQACHVCTHLQRPGGLPPASTTCSASKASYATPSHQHCCIGVMQRSPACETKARSILQRFELFARDLLSGVGLTGSHSRLMQRSACRAMPRRGASLRGVCDAFFAFSQISHSQCLSGGATRRPLSIVLEGRWGTRKALPRAKAAGLLTTQAAACWRRRPP